MAFQMVHRNHGFVVGKRQSIGKTGACEQGAAQTWALGVGDGVDLA